MNIPSWLAGMTNAAAFADPLKNMGAPTFGDALQGIGDSMKSHYLGVPVKGAGGAAQPQADFMEQLKQQHQQMQQPQQGSPFGPMPGAPPAMQLNPIARPPQLLDLKHVLGML
jgi:hypothetical protein